MSDPEELTPAEADFDLDEDLFDFDAVAAGETGTEEDTELDDIFAAFQEEEARAAEADMDEESLFGDAIEEIESEDDLVLDQVIASSEPAGETSFAAPTELGQAERTPAPRAESAPAPPTPVSPSVARPDHAPAASARPKKSLYNDGLDDELLAEIEDSLDLTPGTDLPVHLDEDVELEFDPDLERQLDEELAAELEELEDIARELERELELEASLHTSDVQPASTPAKPPRFFSGTAVLLLLAITLMNGMVAVVTLRSNKDTQTRMHEVGRDVVSHSSNLAGQVQDQSLEIAGLRAPIVPSDPDQHPTFDAAREEIARGDFAAARQRLYSLLAVIDRLDVAVRATVEARAQFMLAEAVHLEAIGSLELDG